MTRKDEIKQQIEEGSYAVSSEQIAQAVAPSLDRIIEARKRLKARVDEVVNADREAVRQHRAANDVNWTRAQIEALGNGD